VKFEWDEDKNSINKKT